MWCSTCQQDVPGVAHAASGRSFAHVPADSPPQEAGGTSTDMRRWARARSAAGSCCGRRAVSPRRLARPAALRSLMRKLRRPATTAINDRRGEHRLREVIGQGHATGVGECGRDVLKVAILDGERPSHQVAEAQERAARPDEQCLAHIRATRETCGNKFAPMPRAAARRTSLSETAEHASDDFRASEQAGFEHCRAEEKDRDDEEDDAQDFEDQKHRPCKQPKQE